MSFFDRFPKTQYSFFGLNNPTAIPDLFRQVKLVEKRLDRISLYQKYFILGSRPDQVSLELYGSPDYYWTMFLVNDNLRQAMNKWPLTDLVLQDFINEKYVGYVLQPYRSPSDASDYNSIAGQFPVGTVITGSGSGATATVRDRIADMNQIVFTYNTNDTFDAGDEFTGVDSDGVVYQLLNTDYNIREYRNAHQRYVDGDGETTINQLNLDISSGIVTYEEYEIEQNDALKEIRVIKPEYIEEFASVFRKLINE